MPIGRRRKNAAVLVSPLVACSRGSAAGPRGVHVTSYASSDVPHNPGRMLGLRFAPSDLFLSAWMFIVATVDHVDWMSRSTGTNGSSL